MRKTVCLLLGLMLAFSFGTTAYAQNTDAAIQGDELPHEHTWIYLEEADGLNHKRICNGCQTEEIEGHSWDGGTVTVEANCIQSGETVYSCSKCQAEKSEVMPQKTTHRFGDWDKNAAGHMRVCQDCLVEESEVHTLQEEILQKPTCKADGAKKTTCSVCGFTETVVLMKLTVHTYDSACDAQCNVCGAERDTEHSPIKVWSSNSKGHWYDCQKCDEQLNFFKHTPGDAATEEKPQVCLICNYIIMPQKAHEHSYGSEWTKDTVGHWHACAKCEQEKDYAAHSYDNNCDSECNTCGYTRENSHVYDMEGWMTSKFEHWNVCTVCGEESGHEKHIPGEEATDTRAQLCTACGYELEPMLEHSHDFGTEWFQNEESHWQKCECGELSVPVSHIWEEGAENTKDSITYVCKDCGAERIAEKENSGFPWLIIILVILALVCLGGIAVLVIMLKRVDSDDELEADEDFSGETEEEPEVDSPEDREEKMIDDYFNSFLKEK